jgi:hypothetical protein
MSYDPYDNEPDAPRRGDRYDYDRPLRDDPERIKARVQAPAICLIVIGILNIFWALYMVVNGFAWVFASDTLIQSQQKMFPGIHDKAETKEQQQMQGILVSFPLALFAFLASVLPIAGGLRMLSLKSYGLAVTGAVAAMIPCLSAMACCGIGEGIGVWALVVLLNPDVKSAFQ